MQVLSKGGVGQRPVWVRGIVSQRLLMSWTSVILNNKNNLQRSKLKKLTTSVKTPKRFYVLEMQPVVNSDDFKMMVKVI